MVVRITGSRDTVESVTCVDEFLGGFGSRAKLVLGFLAMHVRKGRPGNRDDGEQTSPRPAACGSASKTVRKVFAV